MIPIRLDFRIGQERYASRRWPQVPPVGAFVLLGAAGRFPADHNGDATFRVVQTTWGTESPAERDRDFLAVVVFVEHVPFADIIERDEP